MAKCSVFIEGFYLASNTGIVCPFAGSTVLFTRYDWNFDNGLIIQTR